MFEERCALDRPGEGFTGLRFNPAAHLRHILRNVYADGRIAHLASSGLPRETFLISQLDISNTVSAYGFAHYVTAPAICTGGGVAYEVPLVGRAPLDDDRD